MRKFLTILTASAIFLAGCASTDEPLKRYPRYPGHKVGTPHKIVIYNDRHRAKQRRDDRYHPNQHQHQHQPLDKYHPNQHQPRDKYHPNQHQPRDKYHPNQRRAKQSRAGGQQRGNQQRVVLRKQKRVQNVPPPIVYGRKIPKHRGTPQGAVCLNKNGRIIICDEKK